MASTGGGEVKGEQGDDEQDDYNKTHCTSSSDAAHHGVEYVFLTNYAYISSISRSLVWLFVCVIYALS